jgi:hypothetical protein
MDAICQRRAHFVLSGAIPQNQDAATPAAPMSDVADEPPTRPTLPKVLLALSHDPPNKGD